MILVLTLVIGIVAGLRAATPVAAFAWAVHLGHAEAPSWAHFLHASWAPWVFSVAALGELAGDKNPKAPSRKVWYAFSGRIMSGAIVGAGFAYASGSWMLGAICGGIGAIIGTLGGAAARSALARAFGRDLPAALLEDCVAVGTAALVVAFA